MAKILVVDDDVVNRDIIKTRLEAAGYEVAEAANGEEGVNLAQKLPPDLIILDVMMPKVDGLGVLQTLKDAGKKIPTIVMLSNLSHDEAVKEALALGAKDYVIKSEVNPDQLLEKIKKYLD